MNFLETGEFKAVDVEAQTASKEPFSYHLERYERQDFSASRRYLKAQRGLSDDTINFFISQGSIAEAIRKKETILSLWLSLNIKTTQAF